MHEVWGNKVLGDRHGRDWGMEGSTTVDETTMDDLGINGTTSAIHHLREKEPNPRVARWQEVVGAHVGWASWEEIQQCAQHRTYGEVDGTDCRWIAKTKAHSSIGYPVGGSGGTGSSAQGDEGGRSG